MELRIKGVTKYYGTQTALQNVTLDLTPGIIAIMGPNGSGKTTLLCCLASLVQPDRGQLWFDGFDYRKNVASLRSQIGYLPQELDLPVHLTPRRLLTYLATLKNATVGSQVDYLLSALSLEKIADWPFSRLSGGQTRLVGIAQAFLGQPSLLLLDELTRGLDVEERAKVFALARKLVPGRLILFSTHDPSGAERLADRVIILREGQVLFFGKVSELYQKAQAAGDSVGTPNKGSVQGSKFVCQGEDYIRNERPEVINSAQSISPGATCESTFEEAYLRLVREPYRTVENE